MAISLTPQVRGTVRLDELISFCKENVRYEDEDSILAASDLLAALANDRSLLVDAVNSELYRRIEANGNASISTHALILYADHVFKIRANIWKKPVERAGTFAHDNSIYSYDFAHNHNFQLLTVGYLGAGYWTELLECDPDSITGYVGEKVELRYLERTSLPRGRVMLYRTLKDVHTQLPPDEFSVSLNLMVADPTGYVADQYNFDVKQSTIARLISAPFGTHVSALTFAATLGDPRNLDAALALATKGKHWRVRLAAFECSAWLANGQSSSIWEEALRDAHPRVREAARSYIEQHHLERTQLW
jgi:hypothetical protein